MKKERFFELFNDIDDGLITKAEKATAHAGRKKKNLFQIGVIAACICLIISTVIMSMAHSENKIPQREEGFKSVTLDVNSFPNVISGSAVEHVLWGQLGSTSVPELAPPEFEFSTDGFIVKARVVRSLPNIYYKLQTPSTVMPRAYRLIEMEVLEVVRGENMPKYFLYMLPEYLFVDMSLYDSLIISMEQEGTENYVMRNGTKSMVESFLLPIFRDRANQPQYGNIIAFSNGIFDEGLLSSLNWSYGKDFLDNPEWHHLVVSRGCTEYEALSNIRLKCKEEDKYSDIPEFISLNFTSGEAKDALEYVKPFKNGVFSQDLLLNRVVFRRYINGCETDETITINFDDEKVTYSDVCYTKEDMECMENIAIHVSDKAARYKEQIPEPPHIDTKGKKLVCLSVFGWYAKSGDKVYGIIKILWIYEKDGNRYLQYYDDSYTLYDISNATATIISRDDLLKLVGNRNVYTGEYGVEVPLPMC